MSIFENQENDVRNLYCKKTINIIEHPTEPVILEIGIHPVMYGWRIRAGFVINDKGHADWYCIDLCAGDNPKHISLIYTTTLNLIAKNLKKLQEDPNCLILSRIFPVFTIKPIVNDLLFPDFLSENIGGKEKVEVTLDELDEWRLDTWLL